MAPATFFTSLQRGFLLLPFAIWATAILGFWLGIPLSCAHLFIAVLLFLAGHLLCFRGDRKTMILTALIPLLWLWFSAWFESTRLDYSGDGRQYHQEAVIQLTLGWNPIYQALTPDVWDTSWAVWLNSLSKFGWIFGAVIAKAFSAIEAAKCLGLYTLPAMAIGGYLTSRLGFQLSRPVAILSGVLVMLNPIAASQLCTNYSDGYTACLGTVAVLTFAEYLRRRSAEGEFRLALSLVLAVSAKFTNLYPALFLAVLLAGWGFRHWGSRAVLATLGRLSLVAGFAVVLLNPNPYLSNLWRYGNLNYPMSGTQYLRVGGAGWARMLPEAGGVEGSIYSAHLPQNFQGTGRVYQFFYSLFSRSEHAASSSGTGARLKYPWSATGPEWGYLAASDGRLAGLGPLYGALFLISWVCLLLVGRSQPSLLLLAGATLLAALANPFGWWARYVGFSYTLIYFGFVAAALLPWGQPKIHRAMLLFFVLLGVGNSLPIFLGQLKHSKRFTDFMTRTFEEQHATQGVVRFDPYLGGTRGYLKERGYLFVGEKVEVRMADVHLRSQAEPCLQNWGHWYEHTVPPDSQEDPKRRIWFFNLQGHYLLRANLPTSELHQAGHCYSRVASQSYKVTSLWKPARPALGTPSQP